MMNIGKRNKRGVTFIELLISTTIAGVAVFGLLALYLSCVRLYEISAHTTVATQDACRVLEQMRSFAQTTLFAVTSTDWTQWASANGCTSLPQEQVVVVFNDLDGSGDPFDDDPLAVQVNVVWAEGGELRQPLTLSTLLTRR
ncbi:MAG: prepilin-type N-terminal cleavage/methylation domain-containing protein [Candidatus Omnitrophica bacterium]|nr:prepilin-type N-terminal cleavage/methylation domain-containing protein [Candidatus Omnitrophota bacterium]